MCSLLPNKTIMRFRWFLNQHWRIAILFLMLLKLRNIPSYTQFRWGCATLFTASPSRGLSLLGSSSKNRLNQSFLPSTIRFGLFSYMMNPLLILILVEAFSRVRCFPFSLFSDESIFACGGYHGIEGSNRSPMKLSVAFYAKIYQKFVYGEACLGKQLCSRFLEKDRVYSILVSKLRLR